MTDYRDQQRVRADIDALKLKAGSSVWLMERGLNLANDVTETAVFSKTLWGGLLSVSSGLLIEHHISYLNNSGSNRNFTVKFLYGATTLLNDVTLVLTSATAKMFFYRLYLMSNGATNSQVCTIHKVHGPSTFGAATVHSLGEATAAEDSTTDLAVSITWTHSFAAATITADERITIANFVGQVS